MAMMIYQGMKRPGSDKLSNRFDFFNEAMILLCTETVVVFTAWIDDPVLQANLGWFWIAFLLLMIILNMIIIFHYSIWSFKLVVICYRKKLKIKW